MPAGAPWASGFELVERGIDARDAASAILDIDAQLRRCDEAIARLGQVTTLK